MGTEQETNPLVCEHGRLRRACSDCWLSKAEAENEKLRASLKAIEKEADQFYRKWKERAGDHPLIGFACSIELMARESLRACDEGDKK